MTEGGGALDPVLVTGGSGFVGACVVHALLEREHRVHVLLRGSSRPWRLAEVMDRVVVHQADLLDADQTRSVVNAIRPAVVLHLAAYGAYEVQSDARQILNTNILGTYNLLEASASAGVNVFVNTGSSSEYGFKAQPMAEEDLLEPNSFYAVGKAAQSHLCTLFAKRHPMKVAAFRLFSTYGPWEEPARLIPTMLRRARAGLPLELVHPEVARDFIYVEDVVDALLDWPSIGRLKGDVINLGTGRETTLREVVATVLELTNGQSEIRWGAYAARQWDSNRWCSVPTRAERLLGWKARHNLRQGLKKMLTWMDSRGDEYGKEIVRKAA